ncbi:hypothetical protein Dimus_021034 [Dionaea muscipula]
MPCFPPRPLSVSEIQRCIPRKWKGTVERAGAEHNKLRKPNTSEGTITVLSKIRDELMIEQLQASLEEFIGRGHLGKAFGAFSQIQFRVTSASWCGVIAQSISCLLKACADFESLPQGRQLHAQIITLGLDRRPLLIPKLVTLYSTFDLLSDACFIAESSQVLHPLPWNVVISAYNRNGHCKEALEIYEQMMGLGIRPDKFTYPSVLKACGELLDLDFGRKVHMSIRAGEYMQCLYVQNALIAMYGKCGDIEAARQVFDEMCERDVVSCNSIISAYVLNGMAEEASKLSKTMLYKGFELNIITLNTIASGYLQSQNFNAALQLIAQMRVYGILLDGVALIIALSACSHLGAIKPGKEIHGLAIRIGSDEFQNVKNALITMYSKCKDLKDACLVFRLMKEKSVITWNAIISGYASSDKLEEASFLFREMFLSAIKPNYVTIASILPLCARAANFQYGKEFHGYITRCEGFKDYLLLWNSLVEMYARSGKVSSAKRLFGMLNMKDEVTYTSLIAGYGIQGDGEVALELFKEMIDFGIKPDHVTMVAVLSACSHSGLVIQGQRLFENMSRLYGINPCVEHFACMVDLYGRAGLFKKAKEIILKMPYQPSAAMWATLIGACHIHGNMELGEWAAEKLLDLRPTSSGYYVLISNMYAAAGCWDKLAIVRKYMRDLGVRKDTGSAWVDIGSGFQPFSAGDTPIPLADEIYALLDSLNEQTKDDGYFVSEDFVEDAEAF